MTRPARVGVAHHSPANRPGREVCLDRSVSILRSSEALREHSNRSGHRTASLTKKGRGRMATPSIDERLRAMARHARSLYFIARERLLRLHEVLHLALELELLRRRRRRRWWFVRRDPHVPVVLEAGARRDQPA